MNAHARDSDLNHVLEHTEHVLREFDGARIFITGGTGFLGKPLVESLLWAVKKLDLKIHTTILTRNVSTAEKLFSKHDLSGHVDFVSGDVSALDSKIGTFTHMIHGAATPSDRGKPSDATQLEASLIAGTRNMLDLAARSAKPRLLFLSSGAVYSPKSGAYEVGKRQSEALCLAASHGLAPILARCFSFLGPSIPLDGAYAIGNFIRDARAGGPIRVNGDGTATRSFLHTSDMAIWLWTLLFKGKASTAYDVGSDQAINMKDLARTIAGFYKCDYKIVRQPVPGAAVDVYIPIDLTPAHSLGLRTWIPLQEAIRRTDDRIPKYFP